MHARALLEDLYGRIGPTATRVVDGLDDDALTARVDPEANTIAWLAWHLARGQDAQVAAAVGRDEVWTRDGWARRFDLPFGDDASGYGQSPEEVGQVRASGDLLLGYVHAVQVESHDVLASLADDDLDRVVDESWDPPVTLGARLVSVAVDALEHAGQAAYVRGVLERTGRA
ncbi:DinB family protein [Cellulosimicrobium sp. Marseille-Q4280]|uniref:mycothiol transferase n=1 Tax=Cellulosimicrobium sp. Marseille-Q4280 TaxID=2937992 RepID=UPI00203F338E|nr:DinB family protein [Cellulosimicrobium sp. Marseille-Q4280]